LKPTLHLISQSLAQGVAPNRGYTRDPQWDLYSRLAAREAAQLSATNIVEGGVPPLMQNPTPAHMRLDSKWYDEHGVERNQNRHGVLPDGTVYVKSKAQFNEDRRIFRETPFRGVQAPYKLDSYSTHARSIHRGKRNSKFTYDEKHQQYLDREKQRKAFLQIGGGTNEDVASSQDDRTTHEDHVGVHQNSGSSDSSNLEHGDFLVKEIEYPGITNSRRQLKCTYSVLSLYINSSALLCLF